MRLMNKPIYQIICENIVDGRLKEGFSLPDENEDPNVIHFAPGAMDGIHMYHIRPKSWTAEQAAGFEKVFLTAVDGNYAEADNLFAAWTKNNSVISIIDDMQKFVVANAGRFDPEKVFMFSRAFVLYSVNIECVKIGMAMLELLSNLDKSMKEAICRLGLYDEFTVFAVWNMLKWENGNQLIFELAQKVHGWGRIHAIDCLEPETEEIREWLLIEGYNNDIMSAYSALTCWGKSQTESILFSKPTETEFHGMIGLIDGLLNEGPVCGMSVLDNAEKILLRFLELFPAYNISKDDMSVVRNIWSWAEDDSHAFPAIVTACKQVIRD